MADVGAGAGHVVLLGDSIFDNGAYTRGEPDVVTHLRRILPSGWTATLCAVDGATTASLPSQLPRVPPDASHLVLAVGGNDALQSSDLLGFAARSSAEVLSAFAQRLDRFESSYRAVLERVADIGARVAVCTIYNGALPPEQAPLARVGLMMFNDVILRTAVERRVDAIELRLVCCSPADFANPIEPSGEGGRKIAAAIVRAVTGRPGSAGASRVWSV